MRPLRAVEFARSQLGGGEEANRGEPGTIDSRLAAPRHRASFFSTSPCDHLTIRSRLVLLSDEYLSDRCQATEPCSFSLSATRIKISHPQVPPPPPEPSSGVKGALVASSGPTYLTRHKVIKKSSETPHRGDVAQVQHRLMFEKDGASDRVENRSLGLGRKF